jgi:hypothetical protein
MRLPIPKRLSSSMAIAIAVAISLPIVGCSESADQATARRKRAYNIQDQPPSKYSGTVTIDGLPPAPHPGHELLVFLYDPKSEAGKSGRAGRYAVCKSDGSFQFGDAVQPGSYIVAFAELERGRPGIFRGPDLLTNLYNDPDQNATRAGFAIDLTPPGKNGVSFNLEVAGKDPVTTPGPHAVVKAGWAK